MIGVFKVLGIKKLKDVIRFFGKKIFPELAFIEANFFDFKHLRSSIKDTETGKHVKYYEPFHINHSRIGDYTYISSKSWITHTTIGKFCSIGPNLVCGWGIHPVESLSTSPMFYSSLRQNGVTLSHHDKVQERKPITIGNDVFIGMNVTILDGVIIGDGAVIGAGAVVSKDIPPYAIAVGNPIQIIRYRFSDQIIEKLLLIKWWDFDETQLQDVERYCFDIRSFIERYLKDD
ncbi:antibiotic acetyltransferase [candidate division KSB1 bacterium]|nr:antibiotic acetyltransferase [candidate division KSB1 bacterium]